jgi:peptide methionine sulfoxide reductase MsrB
MLYPKNFASKLPKSPGIADPLNTTKNYSSDRKSSNLCGFPAFEDTISIPKMHKTSIHVSLKEIRGETHSNPRNHIKNKGTKTSMKKTTKNTTLNLLYKPGKIHKV